MAETLNMRQLIDKHVPDLWPQPSPDYPGRNVTVLGSFKAWQRIKAVRAQFRDLGFHVLGPLGEEITHYAGTSGTFEVLDTDAAHIAQMEQQLGRQLNRQEVAVFLEALFIGGIMVSDLCYVVGLDKPDIDDGGYIGTQVAVEIGCATGRDIPVFGEPISPSLDEREGMGSMFWAYAALIETATPEELAVRFPQMG